jgi:hypothetical protein
VAGDQWDRERYSNPVGEGNNLRAAMWPNGLIAASVQIGLWFRPDDLTGRLNRRARMITAASRQTS